MNRLLLLLSNTLLVLLEVIVLTFFASIFFKKNLSTVKFLISIILLAAFNVTALALLDKYFWLKAFVLTIVDAIWLKISYMLQEVFLYVAKNFSKIHRENCHELAAYLVSCSRSRAYDMLRKQREELLEDVPNEPDAAPVPDDAAVSTDNIERLTELIGQMKPMYRDPLRLLAMGYTNREIAKSLGLTDEVVRTRLFRGRKLLWKEMNSHE